MLLLSFMLDNRMFTVANIMTLVNLAYGNKSPFVFPVCFREPRICISGRRKNKSIRTCVFQKFPEKKQRTRFLIIIIKLITILSINIFSWNDSIVTSELRTPLLLPVVSSTSSLYDPSARYAYAFWYPFLPKNNAPANFNNSIIISI